MISSAFIFGLQVLINIIGCVIALYIIVFLTGLVKGFVIDFVEMSWESIHRSSYQAYIEKRAKKKKLKKSKASQ